MAIEHEIPCVKKLIGVDTLGRKVWRLDVRCQLASKITVTDDGHWLWTAALNTVGYPVVTVGQKTRLAHRVMYELLVGPIPLGYEVDHVCRVVTCVNPEHLEAVTPRENKRRSSTPWGVLERTGKCVNGHPRTSTGSCRQCMAERQRRNRDRINARRRSRRASGAA